MLEFRTILVPVDFSEHASRAFDAALDLAKTFQGRLHLIHSYPLPPVAMPPYDVSLPLGFDKALRDASEKQLGEWAARARKAGIEAAITVTPESPSEAIVSCAEKIGADLIVMGTRGLTGLKHVVLGSVAERTLRLAPCPVLTLKAT
jgi:nucleotide-binding universal stress UspA family protein